jgi:hypothetical protein
MHISCGTPESRAPHHFSTTALSTLLYINQFAMPIVGPLRLNVSDYSHSTVFTTILPSVVINNVPPLTKIYTQSAECVDRWMLADNTLGTTTFVQTIPEVGATSTRRVTAQAVSGVTPIAGPVKRDLTEPQPFAQAFNLTVWSIPSNPLFTSCQPYSSQPLYSPGVCPDGRPGRKFGEAQVVSGRQVEKRRTC